jgi:hypothetical protein
MEMHFDSASGRPSGPTRIPARNLDTDPGDQLVELIDPSEILFGFTASAAANRRFNPSAKYSYKRHWVYICTSAGTYETEYKTIDGILGDFSDAFVRAHHGLFVNYKKIVWFEKLGAEFQLAGFFRRDAGNDRYDEWITMSRIQGRLIYNLAVGSIRDGPAAA